MRKFRKRWYVIAGIALVLLLFNTGFYIMGAFFPNVLNKGTISLPTTSQEKLEQNQKLEEAISALELQSPYVLVLDLQDASLLYEKNSTDRIYPASLTKVMSTMVALDHIPDLSQTVTVTPADLEGLAEANASVAGLQVGDTLTYEDLLYAMMLPSGADAANLLADRVFGGMDAYVESMNQKAQAIGMLDTHFVNASGLHEDDHYTTLANLKIMMDHAWINTAFQKVMTTTTYTIESIPLELGSTLLSYGGSLDFPGGEIIGGKSGYTLEAECCLVSVAKLEDGSMYMVISAKADGNPLSDHKHINDAKAIYEKIATTR